MSNMMADEEETYSGVISTVILFQTDMNKMRMLTNYFSSFQNSTISFNGTNNISYQASVLVVTGNHKLESFIAITEASGEISLPYTIQISVTILHLPRLKNTINNSLLFQ